MVTAHLPVIDIRFAIPAQRPRSIRGIHRVIPADFTDQSGAKDAGPGIAEPSHAAIDPDGAHRHHAGIVRVAVVRRTPVAAAIVAGHTDHDHPLAAAAILDRLADGHCLDLRNLQLRD